MIERLLLGFVTSFSHLGIDLDAAALDCDQVRPLSLVFAPIRSRRSSHIGDRGRRPAGA